MPPLEPDHAPIRQPKSVLGAVLALAVLVVPASAQQADIDSAFYGKWEGDVSEQGVEVSYPMSLHIFEQKGRIYQTVRYGPPADCAGGGMLMKSGTGSAHFFELITENRSQCSDGSMRLYLAGEGTLVWEWFYPDGAYAARAKLTLQK